MEDKKTAYEIVAQSIITSLEAGNIPAWRKEWATTGVYPTSLSSKKQYRGTNQMLLMFSTMANGYTSKWWGTYKQIEALGGTIIKGSKATPIVLWKPYETTDKDGNPKKGAMMRYFSVFCADQAEWDGGMPETEKPEARTEARKIEEAQAILDAYFAREGAPSLAYGGDRAYYSPSKDAIQLPEQTAFTNDEAFYSTAYHEAGHSTGHKSRLSREGITEAHYFGDAVYSEEELVAELTATFLCAETGIAPSTIENSTAYIAGWLKVLKSDPKVLVKSASRAQKASDYILGITPPAKDESAE